METIVEYTNQLIAGAVGFFALVLGFRVAGTLILLLARAAFRVVSEAD